MTNSKNSPPPEISPQSSLDSLIDCLRYRPVATTAAQMREAADALERLTAELDKWRNHSSAQWTCLTAERDRLSLALEEAQTDMQCEINDLTAERDRLRAAGTSPVDSQTGAEVNRLRAALQWIADDPEGHAVVRKKAREALAGGHSHQTFNPSGWP